MTRRICLPTLALLAFLASCGEPAFVPAWGDAPPPPNILFVSVDTLRADHLGYDGYDKPTSPNIDAWAESAMVFENAQASASWTLPGLASALTGTYCSTHRCWGFGNRLDPSFPTVTELLLTAGYDTACVTSHIFLATRYGLQQGFVHFDDSFSHPDFDPKDSITSEMVSDKGIDFLTKKAATDDGVPWMLWLHYFDPHDSFLFHEGFSEPFVTGDVGHVETEVQLYDGEIRFTDFHIGRVFDALRETGLMQNTVVVFFSDHGEEFMDHDSIRHGHNLWRELTRVPFAISGPGITAGRYAPTIRTIDLLPTVLDLAGQSTRTPDGLPGKSLAPILRGDGPAPDTSLSLSEIALSTSSRYKSFIDGPWKVIWHIAPGDNPGDDEWRLFNLESDPLETTDLSSSEPEVHTRMQDRLKRSLGAALELANNYETSGTVDMSASVLADLRGLGYVGDDKQATGASSTEDSQ